MLTIDQFGYISIQAAVFLADPDSFSQARFLSAVLAEFSEHYDGDVQSLPLSDVPAEFPRVTLMSQDKRWRVRASSARVDSFWEGQERVDDICVQLDKCWEVLKEYLKTEIVVNRLGLVVQRTLACDDPAQELVQHFFADAGRSALFQRSSDFEIHSHTVEQLPDLFGQVNNWNRCRTARLTKDDQPIVVFVQDINTVPAPNARFDLGLVDTFYRAAFERMRQVGQDYFPGETEQ